MARIARNQFETAFFHNMTQGINKEYIFEENRCKKKYLELIEEKSNQCDIRLISYTIMDNHSHILLYTENIENMSSFMKKINEEFAMYYNYINNRVGIVFRNRYRTQPILSEKQLFNCIRYIYNNPVRANMVLNPEEYIYSNFKDFQVEFESNNFLDIVNKKINCQFSFPKNEDKELVGQEEFLDTTEDKEIFVRDFIKEYQKDYNFMFGKNIEEMKKLVKYLKENMKVSNNLLSELLHISKSTITRYYKSSK